MIAHASKNKPYFFDSIASSEDLLQNEILAFPVAKILLSLHGKENLFGKFASMVASSALKHIEREKNAKEVLFELAKDLGINFSLAEEPFLVSVPVSGFLQIGFNDPSMKLVNQQARGGKVFLDENGFRKFVAEKIFSIVFSSLPVDTAEVPLPFRKLSKQLSSQLANAEMREFEFKFAGKINPNFFPPCIAEMYAQILEGKNLPHLARFDLATFLAAIGLPTEQIIDLFRKTPNFSEKITRYQVERIAGKRGTKYSPPSCAKLKEHGFPCSRCNVKHPLQYYKRELSKESKKKAD
jgi:DNA primase large subunit